MALKKACCPHCHIENTYNRVFEINPEATVCFCPNCLSKLEPKEAIEEYEKLMSNLVNDADIILFDSSDHAAAYKAYASIIEIDSGYVRARFGRIVSLITLSTLRKPMIKQAHELFNTDYEQFFKNYNNAYDCASFYYRLVLTLSLYISRVKKRLTYRDFFFGLDCLTLYYYRLVEVVNFLDSINIAFERLKRLFPTNKTVSIVENKIEKIIKKEKIVLIPDEKYILCNGVIYSYQMLSKTGEPLFVRDKYGVNHKLSQKLIPTIEKTNHHHLISDELFKNRRNKMRVYRHSLFWGLLFLGIAICFALVSFFTYQKLDLANWAIIVSFGGLFLLASIFFFVAKLAIKREIKKRHKRYFNLDIDTNSKKVILPTD